MKDKILMIAYTNYPTDPRVIREAEALVLAGYDVDFLALKREGDPNTEIINGVNVIHLNQLRYRGESNLQYLLSYLLFFFKVLAYSFKTLFSKNYKVVHVNNMPDFMVFAAIMFKLKGAKLVLDIHDPMPSTYRTKFGLSKKSLLYKIILYQERVSAWFSDKILTVHDLIKYEVLKNDGIDISKIEVVANFADEKKFKFNNNYKIDDTINFVFHGTIAERFGFERLLEEIYLIKDKKFTLTFIGEGDYSKKLRDQILKYKFENVYFDNKFYAVDELYEILQRFHVGLVSYYISPATDYMLPLKFLEYFSMGIPALCVRNKAISYYFEDDDAFFFDLEKKGNLSKLIINLLNNKTSLLEKHNRIKERRKKFLWSNEAQKYITLIKKLCEVKSE